MSRRRQFAAVAYRAGLETDGGQVLAAVARERYGQLARGGLYARQRFGIGFGPPRRPLAQEAIDGDRTDAMEAVEAPLEASAGAHRGVQLATAAVVLRLPHRAIAQDPGRGLGVVAQVTALAQDRFDQSIPAGGEDLPD